MGGGGLPKKVPPVGDQGIVAKGAPCRGYSWCKGPEVRTSLHHGGRKGQAQKLLEIVKGCAWEGLIGRGLSQTEGYLETG